MKSRLTSGQCGEIRYQAAPKPFGDLRLLLQRLSDSIEKHPWSCGIIRK